MYQMLDRVGVVVGMSCIHRYFALQLSYNSGFDELRDNRKSEEKMIAEPVETSANSLKVSHVKAKKILELKLDDARKIRYMTFKGKDGQPDTTKIEAHVTYKGITEDDPDMWTINNKSRNILIKAFGKDTDGWVNKSIPITIAGEGEMQHILVDAMRIGA